MTTVLFSWFNRHLWAI